MAKSKAKAKVKAQAKTKVKAAKASKKTSTQKKKSAVLKSAAKKTSVKKKTLKVSSKVKTKVKSKTAKVVQKSAKQKVQPVKKQAAQQKTTLSAMDKKLSLVPLDDRIVVEVATLEKKTPGGLYIPETSSLSGNFQGKVVAVGHGHRNKKGKLRPLDVKLGDQVMFSEHAGDKMNIQGKDVLILRESEVLGIVQK